jgi:hypothetical protein
VCYGWNTNAIYMLSLYRATRRCCVTHALFFNYGFDVPVLSAACDDVNAGAK